MSIIYFAIMVALVSFAYYAVAVEEETEDGDFDFKGYFKWVKSFFVKKNDDTTPSD